MFRGWPCQQWGQWNSREPIFNYSKRNMHRFVLSHIYVEETISVFFFQEITFYHVLIPARRIIRASSMETMQGDGALPEVLQMLAMNSVGSTFGGTSLYTYTCVSPLSHRTDSCLSKWLLAARGPIRKKTARDVFVKTFSFSWSIVSRKYRGVRVGKCPVGQDWPCLTSATKLPQNKKLWEPTLPCIYVKLDWV